jgi:hypothetical protein
MAAPQFTRYGNPPTKYSRAHTGLIGGRAGSILVQRARRFECAAQKSLLGGQTTSALIRLIPIVVVEEMVICLEEDVHELTTPSAS